MFSFPLFKQSIKSNLIMWGSMTLVMTILCIQFSAMDMTQSLLFVIFYGMMTTILPGIYVLVTANKMVSSQVDSGSMAYVLSTPTRRSTVVFTQSVFLTISLIAMFAVQTVGHLLVNNFSIISLAKLGYPKLAGDLTNTMILQVNISALVVCIAMAAVCFLFSGIFTASKYSIGFSGTFVGVMVLANMLAMFGNLGVKGLDVFKYITICSFYDASSVLTGTNDWIFNMIYPIVIAIISYVIGSLWFCKKDLPL